VKAVIRDWHQRRHHLGAVFDIANGVEMPGAFDVSPAAQSAASVDLAASRFEIGSGGFGAGHLVSQLCDGGSLGGFDQSMGCVGVRAGTGAHKCCLCGGEYSRSRCVSHLRVFLES
jgi:hypothetical protein